MSTEREMIVIEKIIYFSQFPIGEATSCPIGLATQETPGTVRGRESEEKMRLCSFFCRGRMKEARSTGSELANLNNFIRL